jgi:hypothetical protein
MTNHVHLLVTPHSFESCAKMMKNLGQHHVQRINSRRNRTGTLWEGRFYSCPVTTERHVLACYRYIELNPVEPEWGLIRPSTAGRATDSMQEASPASWSAPTARMPQWRP